MTVVATSRVCGDQSNGETECYAPNSYPRFCAGIFRRSPSLRAKVVVALKIRDQSVAVIVPIFGLYESPRRRRSGIGPAALWRRDDCRRLAYAASAPGGSPRRAGDLS